MPARWTLRAQVPFLNRGGEKKEMSVWKVVIATSYEIDAEDSNEAVDRAFEELNTALSCGRRIGEVFGANAELIG